MIYRNRARITRPRPWQRNASTTNTCWKIGMGRRLTRNPLSFHTSSHTLGKPIGSSFYYVWLGWWSCGYSKEGLWTDSQQAGLSQASNDVWARQLCLCLLQGSPGSSLFFHVIPSPACSFPFFPLLVFCSFPITLFCFVASPRSIPCCLCYTSHFCFIRAFYFYQKHGVIRVDCIYHLKFKVFCLETCVPNGEVCFETW